MMVMVLNDGETYTNLDGCMIVKVPDKPIDEIEPILDNFLRSHTVENRAAGIEIITVFQDPA